MILGLASLTGENPNAVANALISDEVRDKLRSIVLQPAAKDPRSAEDITKSACLLALSESTEAAWMLGDTSSEMDGPISGECWEKLKLAAAEYVRVNPHELAPLVELLNGRVPAISRSLSRREPFDAMHTEADMLLSAWLRTNDSKMLLKQLAASPYRVASEPVESELKHDEILDGDITLRFQLISRISVLLTSEEQLRLINEAKSKPDVVYSLAVAYGLAVAGGAEPTHINEVLSLLNLRLASHEALRMWLTSGIAVGEKYQATVSDLRKREILAASFQERGFPGWFLNSDEGDKQLDPGELSTMQFLRKSPVTPRDTPIERGDSSNWYRTSNGITFVKLEGGIGLRGNHDKEPYLPRQERFTPARVGPFDLAMTEITIFQFLEFAPESKILKGKNQETGVEVFTGQERVYQMHVACPMIQKVDLFTAAEFCNWVTHRENKRHPPSQQMTPCYEIEFDKKQIRVDENGTGFRLPTIDEWEFACRAGSKMRWSHGDNERLHGEHARFFNNSIEVTWPVASLAPNTFGLFDMHGNVSEWTCHTVTPIPDGTNQQFEIPPRRSAVVDGSCFVAQSGGEVFMRPGLDRCSRRIYKEIGAGAQLRYVGIRLARTAAN